MLIITAHIITSHIITVHVNTMHPITMHLITMYPIVLIMIFFEGITIKAVYAQIKYLTSYYAVCHQITVKKMLSQHPSGLSDQLYP